MFLRCKVRRKDGKQHRYWSVVENTRVAGGRMVQRHVLYLGEINDSQELAWRRAIEVLDDGGAPAAPMGRMLAGADAMARTEARPVLVEAAGSEPQRDALGSGAVRAGRLSS